MKDTYNLKFVKNHFLNKEITEEDFIRIIELSKENTINTELKELYLKYGLNEDQTRFERFNKYIKNNYNVKDDGINQIYYDFYFFGEKTIKEKIEFFLSTTDLRKYTSRKYSNESLQSLYEELFKDDLDNLDIIRAILIHNKSIINIIYKFISKDNMDIIMNLYPNEILNYGFELLDENESKSLLSLLKNKGVMVYVEDRNIIFSSEFGKDYKLKTAVLKRIIKNQEADNEDVYKLANQIRYFNINKNTIEKIRFYGLDKDKERLELFIDYALKDSNNQYREKVKSVIDMVFFEEKSFEERLEFINYVLNNGLFCTNKIIPCLCELLFKDEEIYSFDTLSKILDKHPTQIRFFNKYITSDIKPLIIDRYPKYVYQYLKDTLNEKELEIIKDKLIEQEELKPFLYNGVNYKCRIDQLMAKHKSDILDRLLKTYGESYEQKTKLSKDDHDTFMYNILKSNVIDKIYGNDKYSLEDIYTIQGVIQDYELRNMDTTIIRKRIAIAKDKYKRIDHSLFATITTLKDDYDTLGDYLSNKNITKDNYDKYIRTRKYLDKTMKETLLLILAKYYRTAYISIFDILSIIQESEENNIPLGEVLKKYNLKSQEYKEILKRIKYKQPDLFSIVENANKEKRDNLNRRTRAYNILTSENINNYDLFVSRYKKTPEEVLELFKYSKDYDEVYSLLSSWYNFNNEDIKELNRNKNNMSK